MDGVLNRISAVIDAIRSNDPTETAVDDKGNPISLFGVVKTKRCLLSMNVTVNDDKGVLGERDGARHGQSETNAHHHCMM